MRAVVPAHDEATTIANVLRTLVASQRFDEILVVDDGSTDSTADVARAEGVSVLVLPRNVGKGEAMLEAYRSLPVDADDRVAFFDADLLDLGVDHVAELDRWSARGYDMVSITQPRLVPIGYLTGIRVVRRWVLDELPESCWCGYCIETAMNYIVRRHSGRSVRVDMRPIKQRSRLDKLGILGGIHGHIRTIRQILSTSRALSRSGGTSCL